MDDKSLVEEHIALEPPIKLNLGGGDWRKDGWFTLDQGDTADHPLVGGTRPLLNVDPTIGLPFPDNSADVVFWSDTLENFSHADAVVALAEICRVLRPGAPICLVIRDTGRYRNPNAERAAGYLTTPSIAASRSIDDRVNRERIDRISYRSPTIFASDTV